MKKVSAAVLYTDRKSFLIVKPTNKNYWEIPKGIIDVGENGSDAAVRELQEETGIKVQKSSLNYVGKYQLHPTKDIVLFLCVVNELQDISTLICKSMTRAYGAPVPEIGEFKYILLNEYKKLRIGLHRTIMMAMQKMRVFE